MIEYVWLIPVFPLIGFMINGLMGERLPKNLVGTIGSAMVGLSFALTVSIFLEYVKLPMDARPVEVTVYTWIASGGFKAVVAGPAVGLMNKLRWGEHGYVLRTPSLTK